MGGVEEVMKKDTFSYIDYKELGYFVQHAHEYARRIEKVLDQWKKEDEE